jgi:hypothetical protein
VKDHAQKASDGISNVDKTGVAAEVGTLAAADPSGADVNVGEMVGSEVEEMLSTISDSEVAVHAAKMLNDASAHMTAEELRTAVAVAKDALSSCENMGSVILVNIGSALQEASDLAPDVLSSISSVLVMVGPHLPVIGLAAGALGLMAKTYLQSINDDETVGVFITWCGSVKEWLILVASRVTSSGGESTMSIFEMLNEKLLELKDLLDAQGKRWRITKMLTSQSFAEKFECSKEVVKDLKLALKDYLDAESQQKSDSMLTSIEASTFRVEEKIDNMAGDIGEIKALLKSQADAAAAKAESSLVGEEEEQIYATIQDSVGVERGSAITFKHLVMAFQSFFCKGRKIPAEIRRGLKIAIDEDDTDMVTKLQWIGFYRAWKESAKSMDDYLLEVADNAPPTMFALAVDASSRASQLMGSGALVFKNEKYRQAATEALSAGMEALGGMAAAAVARSGSMNMNMNGMSEGMMSSVGGVMGGIKAPTSMSGLFGREGGGEGGEAAAVEVEAA